MSSEGWLNCRPPARPFHGYVTAVQRAGANSGFARYHLTVEPWTAFLRVGRDSRVFQDQTVLEILDTVFKAYEGEGVKIVPRNLQYKPRLRLGRIPYRNWLCQLACQRWSERLRESTTVCRTLEKFSTRHPMADGNV